MKIEVKFALQRAEKADAEISKSVGFRATEVDSRTKGIGRFTKTAVARSTEVRADMAPFAVYATKELGRTSGGESPVNCLVVRNVEVRNVYGLEPHVRP